jgi:hypothetical protein
MLIVSMNVFAAKKPKRNILLIYIYIYIYGIYAMGDFD